MNAIRAWLLLCALAVTTSFAQESNSLPTIITVEGVTYSNVSWHTVTPATVSIFHQTGVATIPLQRLPPALQKRFGYDAQKAADYTTTDAATQAHLAEHIADVKEAQRIQQLQQALQQQYATIQSQPLQAPAEQSPATQIVPLAFSSVESQPPSNGLNRAILTLTSGGKASVVYGTEGETYLKQCIAQCAVWRQQERNLAQSRSYDPYTGYQQMSYTHPTPTFVVYGAQLDGLTYKLVGNATYQQMGGAVSYMWR